MYFRCHWIRSVSTGPLEPTTLESRLRTIYVSSRKLNKVAPVFGSGRLEPSVGAGRKTYWLTAAFWPSSPQIARILVWQADRHYGVPVDHAFGNIPLDNTILKDSCVIIPCVPAKFSHGRGFITPRLHASGRRDQIKNLKLDVLSSDVCSQRYSRVIPAPRTPRFKPLAPT